MKKAAASKVRTAPAPGTPDHAREAELARGILDAEARAVRDIVIGPSFHQALDLIQRHTAVTAGRPVRGDSGAVVVSGMGKSGIVGMKISATLASLGTPSHFLHPAEAVHGDLGRIRRGDVVLLLSYAGSTEEVVALASIVRQDGVPIIAVTGKPESDLGRLASVVLDLGDISEACPHNLAPTATTTAMLALGDALALALAARRNFGADDFKKTHPGGSLGRQLIPVVEAMRFKAGQNLAVVPRDVTVREAFSLARQFHPYIRPPGALLIVDSRGKLSGIFTDGDFRRVMFTQGAEALDHPIAKVMTKNPKRLTDASVVRDAVQLVREFRIDEVPVVDTHGRPVGLIDVQDLVALKVVEG